MEAFLLTVIIATSTLPSFSKLIIPKVGILVALGKLMLPGFNKASFHNNP